MGKGLERVMGIEPTCAAWKAAVLPLNYTRNVCSLAASTPLSIDRERHLTEQSKLFTVELMAGPCMFGAHEFAASHRRTGHRSCEPL